MEFVEAGADVARGRAGEGVGLEELFDGRRALQEASDERAKPRAPAGVVERGKPHLPVEAGLVWGGEAGTYTGVAGFPRELVGVPGLAVPAAFDDDFVARGRHVREESVAAYEVERGDGAVGGFREARNWRIGSEPQEHGRR
jgi:hypothetical protein